MFPDFVVQHLLYAAVLASLGGALLHWYQQVRRGQAAGDFFQHWFGQTKGYTAGVASALAGGWLIWYQTGTVAKMDPLAAIAFGYMFGFTTDSMIDQAVVAPVAAALEKAADKAAGFIRMHMLALLAVLALVAVCVVGCAMGPRAAAPATVPEGYEASDRLIEKISDGLVALSCGKFADGKCVEAGKPLMPVDSLKIHERVEQAHAALQTSALLGAGQMGDCLGEQRTQAACTAAAMSILTEIDAYLISLGSKQQ